MNKRQLKLTDYEGFIEKFKQKKTTDDCYTPQAYYDAVVEYVDRHVTPLQGREILRPFWPGADYTLADYPAGCIVIDNPPFSIESEIILFYMANRIDFFLFCNGLTATTYKDDVAFHIIKESIAYENGANINTSFVTNVRTRRERIVLAGSLDAQFQKIKKAQPRNKPKILEYPRQVVSAALIKKYIVSGKQYEIQEDYAVRMTSQQDNVFGGGWLIPSGMVDEMERERELERERERKRERERERNNTERRQLSAAAYEVIRRLDERWNSENRPEH